MNNGYQEHYWNPTKFLTVNKIECDYSIIILNRPINMHVDFNIILNLWENAKVRITVDGGTDRWLTFLEKNKIDRETTKPPNLVTGDMDSISERELQYYSNSNETQVVVTANQNETDFTKAVIELKKYIVENELKVDHVIVLCDVSGRFDQSVSNINTLYKARNICPDVRIYILASDSLSWLLVEGTNTIIVPLLLRKFNDWCSLIPFGELCRVTTSGLKWNLAQTVLKFGQIVSTSNTYSGDPEVVVITDKPIVWSMGIRKLYI